MNQPIPMQLTTQRLLLRPYTLEDAPMLYNVAQHNYQHLQRYESGNFLFDANSVEEMKVTIQDLQQYRDDGVWFIFGAFERETGDFVAQLFIGKADDYPPDYDVGYFVNAEHQGRGYVTEAVKAGLDFIFNHLRAHRASLHCDDTNVRSQRVAERCGFTREGHIREDKRNADGSITGTMHYGLLRTEYSQIDSRKG